jgi:hypothetical protein
MWEADMEEAQVRQPFRLSAFMFSKPAMPEEVNDK